MMIYYKEMPARVQEAIGGGALAHERRRCVVAHRRANRARRAELEWVGRA